MTLERSVRVAHDVRGPLMFSSVGVPCADVFVLQGLELLLCAEFVGLSEMHMLADSCRVLDVVFSTYHFVE